MSVVKIEVAHCALDKAGMKNPLVEKCSYSRDGGRSENLGGQVEMWRAKSPIRLDRVN
jgi:hypothetical protein